MGVTEQIKVDTNKTKSTTQQLPEIVSAHYDSDDDDDNEDYSRPIYDDSDNDGDNNNNTNSTEKARIEPLPPIDHNTIAYKPINKFKYQPHPTIASLTEADISALRDDLDIAVKGSDYIPSPIQTFEQAGLHSDLLKEIHDRKLVTPTPIQAQALPIILSGRDMIGLAKTGSGKTYSFVWLVIYTLASYSNLIISVVIYSFLHLLYRPIIMHIVNQPQSSSGDGPIALVLVPTRELANQIYTETIKFAKV